MSLILQRRNKTKQIKAAKLTKQYNNHPDSRCIRAITTYLQKKTGKRWHCTIEPLFDIKMLDLPIVHKDFDFGICELLIQHVTTLIELEVLNVS